jgi:hypothetical protein
MAVKLGELLVKAGLITPAQLDDCLKCQVIFGGRLGTNLIEMGYLEEHDLAQFLSKKLGVPFTSMEQVAGLPKELSSLLPKEVAKKFKVVPLGLEKKRLSLAMVDPTDYAAIDEISFSTGYIIIPYVAPEITLVHALEKLYDIPRETRYINLSGERRGRASVQEPPVNHLRIPESKPKVSTKPAKTPPPLLSEEDMIEIPLSDEFEGFDLDDDYIFSPGTPKASGPATPQASGVAPASSPPVAAEPAAPVIAAPPTPPETASVEYGDIRIAEEQTTTATPPAVSTPEESETPETETPAFETLPQKLAEAKGRDEIAEAVTFSLGWEFERAAMFMVRGNTAIGWLALAKRARVAGFEYLQIPLDAPSVLKVVTEGKSFYIGPVPETPSNAILLKALGGGKRDSVLLLPLLLMGKVVAVLLVDDGEKDLSDRMPELKKIIVKASLAFEILILKNKILSA